VAKDFRDAFSHLSDKGAWLEGREIPSVVSPIVEA
jgi:hypothetical protein